MDLYSMAEYLVMHYGYIGLFIISFTEAFIQPIPPDVFIIGASYFGLNPIISAIVATIGTTLGGLFGYFLGDKLGHPIFVKLFGERYLHKGEEFFNKYGVFGVFIAGISPLPYKVIAWLSGIFEMHKLWFTIGTIVGRFPRFLTVAYFGGILGNNKLNDINIWLFYLINSHYNQILDIIMPIISKITYPLIAIVSIILFLKNRKFWVKLIFILFLAFVIAYSLKYLIHEPRPYFVLDNIHLLCYEGNEPSFPSGHTTLAFALSTALLFYSRKIGAIFLIWAILVAYSRVYVGVHYPFDVFAGAVIGIACGYLTTVDIYKIMNKCKKHTKDY
ncbi:phosphatase PAP2 family protein [Methanocaldococcus fervens]|uniref:Phosphoesterase PA-phosphatase related n=1 Tax=Methanocaldococcus fervens (strain DSM 4213 / JCM 15782 / AG86) TaxID=573064 RepID=C7P9L7_METFA|nr:phosphatase PAP2 family protein [Methanocaldococcus fervens]ACV25249.1 phosphoesterase PA-phosphatase related [Methanocaldococcus fervens AG86]